MIYLSDLLIAMLPWFGFISLGCLMIYIAENTRLAKPIQKLVNKWLG